MQCQTHAHRDYTRPGDFFAFRPDSRENTDLGVLELVYNFFLGLKLNSTKIEMAFWVGSEVQKIRADPKMEMKPKSSFASWCSVRSFSASCQLEQILQYNDRISLNSIGKPIIFENKNILQKQSFLSSKPV